MSIWNTRRRRHGSTETTTIGLEPLIWIVVVAVSISLIAVAIHGLSGEEDTIGMANPLIRLLVGIALLVGGAAWLRRELRQLHEAPEQSILAATVDLALDHPFSIVSALVLIMIGLSALVSVFMAV